MKKLLENLLYIWIGFSLLFLLAGGILIAYTDKMSDLFTYGYMTNNILFVIFLFIEENKPLDKSYSRGNIITREAIDS